MENVDRIIDDYSRIDKERKAFNKLLSFPNSYKIPQFDDDCDLVKYLKNILEKKMPKARKRDNTLAGMCDIVTF